MKITLDQSTLAKAVIGHLRGVGVESDILEVHFRYTRVPYTVFAEVELAEAIAPKPTKKPTPAVSTVEPSTAAEPEKPSAPAKPIVDPDSLPPVEPVTEEPPPDAPAAPLFGGG